ncbi:hypothetical protein PV02_11415 [Methanolobus chelungpuianus]|uniref:DUF2933 domain-containing protein n=2 Tax=Methanolobus chelungpuianus TaxID=502115 RepID=A0AAE3HE20_9EURY|nr:hypothetical protein [Methanolobus chelungpuianus]
MLMMALCYSIPLAGFAALVILGVSNSYLAYGMILLCPLLHLFMIKNMRGTYPSEIHIDSKNEGKGETDT